MGDDFNLADIDWNKKTVSNKSYLLDWVSQTFIEAQKLILE